MLISFVVTAKLISAFVFATYIVQYLFFLNPKFQVSSHLQQLYSLVCVRIVGFSHAGAQIKKPHCNLAISTRQVTSNVTALRLYTCVYEYMLMFAITYYNHKMHLYDVRMIFLYTIFNLILGIKELVYLSFCKQELNSLNITTSTSASLISFITIFRIPR